MQRLNKPAHAPAGIAFFLFLGLAIVPVSLKAAGVHLSFSPRLSAAVDAWKQISEVFGSSYQQDPVPELPALASSDSDAPSITDHVECPHSLIACAGDAEELALNTPKARSRVVLRSFCSQEARAKSAVPALPSATLIQPNVGGAAAEATLEESTKFLKALATMKLETAVYKVRFKDMERHVLQRSFEQRDSLRNFPIPTNLRVLIQMKPPVAAPSGARRSVECKRVASAVTQKDDVEQETPNNAFSFDDTDL